MLELTRDVGEGLLDAEIASDFLNLLIKRLADDDGAVLHAVLILLVGHQCQHGVLHFDAVAAVLLLHGVQSVVVFVEQDELKQQGNVVVVESHHTVHDLNRNVTEQRLVVFREFGQVVLS